MHEFVEGKGRERGGFDFHEFVGENELNRANCVRFQIELKMKTVVSVAYPSLDGRHRASILICFVFIIALPILASSHDQKNGHGSAYTSKSEDKMEFSKNSKDSKISLLDDESDDSGVSGSTLLLLTEQRLFFQKSSSKFQYFPFFAVIFKTIDRPTNRD